jgi:hypothetical protein
MPAPRREGAGARLVFEHPPHELLFAPRTAIDDAQRTASKSFAGKCPAEHHRHSMVGKEVAAHRATVLSGRIR